MFKTIITLIIFFFAINLWANTKYSQLFKIDRPNYTGEGNDGVKYTDLSVQYALKFNSKSCKILNQNPISTSMIYKKNSKHYGKLTQNNRKAFAIRSSQFRIKESQIEYSSAAFEQLGSKIGKDITFVSTLSCNGNNCSVSTQVFLANNVIVSNLKSIDLHFNLVNYPLLGKHPSKNDPIQSLELIGQDKSYCLYGNCP